MSAAESKDYGMKMDEIYFEEDGGLLMSASLPLRHRFPSLLVLHLFLQGLNFIGMCKVDEFRRHTYWAAWGLQNLGRRYA